MTAREKGPPVNRIVLAYVIALALTTLTGCPPLHQACSTIGAEAPSPTAAPSVAL